MKNAQINILQFSLIIFHSKIFHEKVTSFSQLKIV